MICLLNVLNILVKCHENILKCFKVMVHTKFWQFLETRGDNSWTKSELSFLSRHPYQMPSKTWQSFLKIAQGYRSYGVHNNAFMDRRIDSMLIAISPKPISRRITKFNKRSWWYSYMNLAAKFFYFLYENSTSVTLTSRLYPKMGIKLSKTLDLYLPTCKIEMKFLKGSWWYSHINFKHKNFDF